MVPLCSVILSSHKVGFITNNIVFIVHCVISAAVMARWHPINPISCVNGIQDTMTSSRFRFTPAIIASIFNIKFLWVNTTPLGIPVEPEENWINAVSSGIGSWSWPFSEYKRAWSQSIKRSFTKLKS
ncbi:hypothetical protein D1872_287320 [compost metagenome]